MCGFMKTSGQLLATELRKSRIDSQATIRAARMLRQAASRKSCVAVCSTASRLISGFLCSACNAFHSSRTRIAASLISIIGLDTDVPVYKTLLFATALEQS